MERVKTEELVNMAKNKGCVFFRNNFGDARVRFRSNGIYQNQKINSKAFECYLEHELFKLHFNLSRSTLKEALGIFHGMALYDGDEIEQHVRSAWFDNGDLYIDLCNNEWEVVKINKDGWEIIQSNNAPNIFIRHSHMSELPHPISGNTIDALKPLFNIKDENDWLLLIIWIVTAFIPDIARPGLILHGTQGSGKSNAAEILRSCIDPSQIPLASLPRNSGELAQQLAHNYILVLDNLSQLSEWASNDLCRAVTGGGFSKRTLFTEEGDTIFKLKRPFILTGINLPGAAPDLLDRSILIELDRITEATRMTVKEIETRFQLLHPYILGAIFDLLSKAMSIFDDTIVKNFPRMADWAKWGFVVAEVLGIGGEKFLAAYKGNINKQHIEVIESDVVAKTLLEFAKEMGEWRGTGSQLFDKCKELAEKKPGNGFEFPKAPNKFTARMRTLTHTLKEQGVDITFSRSKDRICHLFYKE